MLKNNSPIRNTSFLFNEFTMDEKTSITKINIRGNLNNKDFSSKIGKILEIILPTEVGNIIKKEEYSILTTGPSEWLMIYNDLSENNNPEIEKVLYENISLKNVGSVTNVSDQFTIFSLTGSNIFEVLSKGSPFNFDHLKDNSCTQTLLNNVDVTIVKKDNTNIDLLVRRSFSEYLWDWIKDSASFI